MGVRNLVSLSGVCLRVLRVRSPVLRVRSPVLRVRSPVLRVRSLLILPQATENSIGLRTFLVRNVITPRHVKINPFIRYCQKEQDRYQALFLCGAGLTLSLVSCRPGFCGSYTPQSE